MYGGILVFCCSYMCLSADFYLMFEKYFSRLAHTHTHVHAHTHGEGDDDDDDEKEASAAAVT